MIDPVDLIGLPYRLGADPEKHGAADCLSLARHVVGHYGITLPPAQRSWYRRLRRKDYSVFEEQLSLWGYRIDAPKVGSLALCKTDDGFALGAYWYDGCLSFLGETVNWRPVTALPVVAFYFPSKQNCAKPLA